jgi:hypothetical protein
LRNGGNDDNAEIKNASEILEIFAALCIWGTIA